MKDSALIRFLYTTILGRSLLKILVNPKISGASAHFLLTPSSRWLVPYFIRKYQIDLTDYEVPAKGYASFNEFFTRRKKDSCRSVEKADVVSPCDGLLTVARIHQDSVFYIKHTEYSVAELLKSKKLAEEYQGGTALIYRLTPAHYHRYIWAVSGKVIEKKFISGVLHSVQPVCHTNTKVFIQNTRAYTVLQSEGTGKVVQMEIGALLIGKISNHPVQACEEVLCGQEKGYFEYGGSTIVILLKGHMELSAEVQNREKVGDEIPVCIGEAILKKIVVDGSI